MDTPKKEVIDDIYKHEKPNENKDNSEEIHKKINENRKEDDKNNDVLNTSKLNESHMKRRQGMYNIYPISKKQNQQKESKKEGKEKDEKEKEENEENKINPIIQIILDFENSLAGIILMIIIGIISLLFYDIKNCLISSKYDIVGIAVISILTFYHIFDLIFRNVLLEKSVGSFYFRLQVFSVITLLFDFNYAIFLLFKLLFIHTINRNNKYLSGNNIDLILYIINFLQIWKYHNDK